MRFPLLLGAVLIGLLVNQNSAYCQPNKKKSKVKPLTRELVITPAKFPTPSLRYRLLPELRDRTSGNAALLYYRAFSPEWAIANDKKIEDALASWDRDQPPPEALRATLRNNGLQEIDLGARRTYCDWNMLPRIRKHGFALLLPDIQGFRTHIALLSARSRFHLEEGNPEGAIYTMQTNFSLARDINKGPTLIHMLVAAAMMHITIGEIEHIIRNEESPNLYWALTDLPKPMINLRYSFEGERMFVDHLLPGIRDMIYKKRVRILTQGELDTVYSKIEKLYQELGVRNIKSPFNRLGVAFLAAQAYPDAKKFLLSQGLKPDLVKRIPVVQAALMYEVYNFDRIFDDMTKWHGLPYPVARAKVEKASKELQKNNVNVGIKGISFANLFVPALEKVYLPAYSIQRKIAGLRIVEAIRDYAANNKGKLPPNIDAIKSVPVPLDPFTGKNFQYVVKDNVAFLTAPVPEMDLPLKNANPRLYWQYKIILEQNKNK